MSPFAAAADVDVAAVQHEHNRRCAELRNAGENMKHAFGPLTGEKRLTQQQEVARRLFYTQIWRKKRPL